MGFMAGSSVQQMAKAINDVMGKGRYAAERLVRTESSYFSNQGELQSYRELGIKEYTFLGGGCEICQQLNGRTFPMDDAEAGLNLPPCSLTGSWGLKNTPFWEAAVKSASS